MSRQESIARWWMLVAALASLAATGVTAAETRSAWSLLGLLPYFCLLVAAEHLNNTHGGE